MSFGQVFDEKEAKEAFNKWDSAGRPRGYTIEEAREKLKVAKMQFRDYR